jgi:ABC-type antimicrobial peptide transport system permease subunit
VLSAVHQTGTVPKIVAKLKTGGQKLNVTGRVRFQFSQADQDKIRACIEKLQGSSGATTTPSSGGGRLGGGGGGPGGGFNRGAFAKCLPAQSRNFSKTVVTPSQIVQQVINPPQTNIKSDTYSIAGVDPSQPDIGLITPSQLSSGTFVKEGDDAVVADGYASQNKVALGSKLAINGTDFTVVGIVKPPLGGQSADVYVPLDKLQTLASQKSLTNVVLVRTTSSSNVGTVQKAIEAKFPNAQVASSKQVADQITGSLVSAKNLSNRLGVALAAIAAFVAFLIAALLTLTSVGKRVRELGTLKALGWTQRQVVRQVVGESLATGVIGGILGVALGIVAVLLIGAFAPTLHASAAPASAANSAFGLGALAAGSVTADVKLTAPIAVTVLLIGFGLALAGGLLAGTAGAMRAARLRPADALRNVE